MTVSTSASQTILSGTGAQTSFAFSFIVGSAANVQVIYTDANNNQTVLAQSAYSIVLNAVASGQLWGVGGTVTYPLMGSPIAIGTSLTIRRIIPLAQLTSIINQGAYYPQTIEMAMDSLCLEIQQVAARTGQYRGTWATGLYYGSGDIVVDGANGANTTNYYMCTNANTSGTWATDLANGEWTLFINVAAITADVAAAAASAAAASASATSAASSASSASSSQTAAAASASTAVAAMTSAAASAVTATTQAAIASAAASTAIAAMSTTLAAMSTTLAALSSTNVALMTTVTANLPAITAVALNTTSINALNTTQISAVALSTTQIAALNTTQINALANDITAINALNTTQISALYGVSSNITALSAVTTQIVALSSVTAGVSSLASLGTTALNALALSTTQMTAIASDITQINSLNTTQISTVAMNTTQIAALNTTQINTLYNNITNINSVALSTTQINALNTTQIAALSTTTVLADMATVIANLGAIQSAPTYAANAYAYAASANTSAASLPNAASVGANNVPISTGTSWASLSAAFTGNMTNTGTAIVGMIPGYTNTQGTALSPEYFVGSGATALAQLSGGQIQSTNLTSLNTTQMSALVSSNNAWTGTNTFTTQSTYDNSTKVATTAFVNAYNSLTMATVPLSLGATGGGTYSFDGGGTGAVVNVTASAGIITSVNTIYAGGSGYAVGDIIQIALGNQDNALWVTSVSGTAVTGLSILYGGTGNGTGSMTNVVSTANTTVPFVYTLTGTLTSNATFIMTYGSLIVQSNQWVINNNTTGNYTVTFKIGTGSNTATGTGVVVPQGTNNSKATWVQTDGSTDIWYAFSLTTTQIGLVTATQIASLAASQITGLVQGTQINSITTTQVQGLSAITITSGQSLTTTQIGVLTTGNLPSLLGTTQIGTFGNTTQVAQITTNANGNITAVTSVNIAGMGNNTFGTDTGTPNNIVVTISGATATLGQMIEVSCLYPNTSYTPTLNLNGTGPVQVTVNGGQRGVPLMIPQPKSNGYFIFTSKGTWDLINPSPVSALNIANSIF